MKRVLIYALIILMAIAIGIALSKLNFGTEKPIQTELKHEIETEHIRVASAVAVGDSGLTNEQLLKINAFKKKLATEALRRQYEDSLRNRKDKR